MNKRTENATITFDPEVINEHTSVTFTKITNANGCTIYGKIEKDATEVGSISYETKGNYLITSFKPADRLTQEEKQTIYEAVPGWIKEVEEA